ncbi:MAG: Uma2 family endonuclease [Nostoc sp. DedVER02]|uniref:Uma2 family endonuclease n=1 Tax=unclassified Nostoc TaxID=2593658 RepID=UPI002AD4F81B|nr:MULTISPECIES: Uma2 family endonuclease [unclassified Nostoc]MDZ7988893.1 Uma2 family endonuclease [Nostoc sp. DedVER02]MDZ8112506.1 Uma2 family endonuclease [Nostoc sp. DedVER01b]
MSEMLTAGVHWTIHDVELFAENEGTRYEIVDGELFVSRASHFKHQQTCGRIFGQLDVWSESTGLGEVIPSPGVLFSESDSVIPDVVWATKETLALTLDEAGHLTGAPDLVVEVLSLSNEDLRRDKEAKLKLYSSRGVKEYWIADWRSRKLEVYRREQTQLNLVATLFSNDNIISPLLPGFSCTVDQFFPV